VHLAANDRTRGIISPDVLEALHDGAMFLNIARGELVDEEALLDVARKKHLRVALDVYRDFPHVPSAQFVAPAFDDDVLWYGTPHIGSQTDQAKKAVAMETARIVRAYLVQGTVPNAVNVRTSNSARYQIVIRHRDKVGSLANALLVLKQHGINVEELSTHVFEQAGAACTRLNVVTRPPDACLQEIAAFRDEILHVDLFTLPILA
jgi:D-3-phosphoglycerate dehydrogenase